MANTVIKIKSSGVTGNVPSTLEAGEIAINYVDGKLFYGNESNTTTLFDVITEPAGLNGELQFNDNGTFGASANLSFDKDTNIFTTTTVQTKDLFVDETISGNTLSLTDSIFVGTDATITGNISAYDVNATHNVHTQIAIVHEKIYAGIATEQSTELPNVIAQFSSNSYTYTQVNQQNIDEHGSADYVITADVGDDLTFYTDVGMSGSQYNYYDGYDTPFEPLTGYFLVQGNTGQVGGNMVIGTTAESTNIRFIAGGFENANVVMEMDNDGVTSTKVLTAPTLISTNLSTTTLSATGNVYADEVFANTKLWAGSATALGTLLPNVIAQFSSNSYTYTQVNQQNINENGSADFVVTADVGNDTNFFIDMGIQGSQLEQGTLKPLDGYLLVQGSTIGQVGGNLVIGTISATPGQETRIVAGGYDEANVIVRVTETGVHFNREIISDTTDRIYNWANAAYDAANVAGGNAFTTISVPDYDDVIANTKTTKITIIGQTGIAIGTDASNSTISIATNLIGASNVIIDFGTVTDILGAVTFDYGYV